MTPFVAFALDLWDFLISSSFLFQDDIRSVLKEGRLLLSNLETVKASKRDVDEEREIQIDIGTVQRYIIIKSMFRLF